MAQLVRHSDGVDEDDTIDTPETGERCSECGKPVRADATGVKVYPGQPAKPLPWKHLYKAANDDYQATVRA